MRKRDILIIVACAVALLFSLQQDGSVSLEKAFYEERTTHVKHTAGIDQANDLHYEADLPPPIITDIDGDQYNDMVTISEGCEVQILDLVPFASNSRSTFFRKSSISEYNSPLIKRARSFPRSGLEGNVYNHAIFQREILSIAAGYTSLDSTDQKIAVVFSDWTVALLDKDLNILWESYIKQFSRLKKPPMEVVISVVPNKIHAGDEGAVIVGFRKFNLPQHQTINTKLESSLLDGGRVDPVGEPTHFTYFAYDAKKGDLRWKHESKFMHNVDGVDTHPQHNFKLDVKQHTQHTGEVHWRNYRHDMIRNLPHSFRHPHDIHFTVDHFTPNRLAAKTSDKNKAAAGKASASSSGLSSAMLKKLRLSGLSKLSMSPEKRELPNVVVAHLSKGIEVVHIYTGRTVCQLTPLQRETVYADLNGDTAIDSAQALIASRPVFRTRHENQFTHCIGKLDSGASSVSEPIFNDTICAVDGVLKQFSVKFLRERKSDSAATSSDQNLQTVPPAVIHRFDHARNMFVTDVVFLVSNGLLSSVTTDETGEWRVKWRAETNGQWSGSSSVVDKDPEKDELRYPQVSAFPLDSIFAPSSVSASSAAVPTAREQLQHLRRDDYILVVGDEFLSVVSADTGDTEELVRLPRPPSAPVIFADINSDGLNDVIVTTRHGYFAFVTRTQTGSSVFTFLIGAVLVIVVLMYASTHVDLKDPYFEKTVNLRE